MHDTVSDYYCKRGWVQRVYEMYTVEGLSIGEMTRRSTPAIHKYACAIDVIGLIGCKKYRDAAKIFRLANALVGN